MDAAYRVLEEHGSELIARHRADGTIAYVSQAYEKLLGFAPSELVGSAALALFHPEERARLQNAQRALLSGAEKVGSFLARLRRQDGSYLWVDVNAYPVPDQGGRPRGYVTVARDVSQRLAERPALAETLEQLVHAREAAEAGSRSKTSFLANMSHEIRTPMNAIIGLSHLALEADPPPKHREYLSQIHAAGMALLDIINDVLDVSKIEAGKLTLEAAPFELDRVLEGVGNVISVRAEEKKLELTFAVDPRIPDELVGDRVRLGQVLMNLASNAVKFTERGEIAVAVELLGRDPQNARLRFAVRDTGIGMRAEQLARLFQPFSQVDSSSDRKHAGSGLGLAISQQLVRMMGGEIAVESAPERGSQFSFEISLGVHSAPSELRNKLPSDVRDLQVLVVDDSQVAREVLTRSLLAMGFTVCAVPSARAALSALRRAAQKGGPYRLALIDACMPEMDGVELATRLASGEVAGPAPATIMISAHSREEVCHGRGLPGIHAFLRKPISRSTLLDTIMNVLHQAALLPTPESESKPRKQPLSGRALLVVEDNEINQVLARDLLEAAGARVALASGGQEAIRIALGAEPPFDLIFMDVQMPGMDGHATTRLLRAEPKTRATPIIAMTAHAFDVERAKCLASGMNAHIAKPINPRELVDVVLRWTRPDAPTAVPAAAAQAPEPAPARDGGDDGGAQTSGAPAAHGDRSRSFDPSALAQVFREPARQLSFLRKFVDSAESTLRELEPAWESRAAHDIGFAGHKLKSSAKACGAHAFAELCATLERRAKEGDWSQLELLRGEPERLLAEVAHHVRQLIAASSALSADEKPPP